MKKNNTEIYPAGTKVCKISGKPFKSGESFATVKDVVINEQDPKKRQAYTFEEDDSVVNVDLCISADQHVASNLAGVIVGDTLHIVQDDTDINSYVAEKVTDVVVKDEFGDVYPDDPKHVRWICTENHCYSMYDDKAKAVAATVYICSLIATEKNKLIDLFIAKRTERKKELAEKIRMLNQEFSDTEKAIDIAKQMKKHCNENN